MTSKKIMFLSALLLCAGFSRAESGKVAGMFMEYQVLSDVQNDSVPAGTFAVRGHVYDMYSGQPIAHALVTNSAENPFAASDSSGFFEMLFAANDTALYCYKDGLTEVILPGPFTNKHVITVNFYLRDPQAIIVVTKPVIYAYNADEVINLSLSPGGFITFTYPESVTGKWSVLTHADGTLTNIADGKNYPYLFWEAEQNDLKILKTNNTAEGFLIKTDSCISFLENTLMAYGLNEKEMTDFITFWGPKMIEKEFAFVQFLPTARYNEIIAGIDVDPKPETLLRLYMYLLPLDKNELPFEVKSPEIQPLIRKGFTIIEWGGSVLKPEKKLN